MLTTYTAEEMKRDGYDPDLALKIIKGFNIPANASLTFRFYDAPKELRDQFAYNGGDEDFLTITRPESTDYDDGTTNLTLRIGIYNRQDCYDLGEYRVFVTSH